MSKEIEVMSLLDFIALEIDEPESVMGGGLLVPEGRIILYGSPGSYKSFATMQLCVALNSGDDWLGYEIEENVKTLYLQGELVPPQMQNRAKDTARALALSDHGVQYGYVRDVVLATPDDWEALEKAMRVSNAGYTFLDPLSQLLSGSELDDKLMRHFLNMLDKVGDATGSGVGFIHHPRKGDKDGRSFGADDLRGHSTLNGWSDTIVRFSKIQGMPGVIELDWQKTRHRPEIDKKWLRFDGERGILVQSEKDPKGVAVQLLQEGPRPIKEFDAAIRKSGYGARRTLKQRQAWVDAGFLIEYSDPVTKSKKLIKLAEEK